MDRNNPSIGIIIAFFLKYLMLQVRDLKTN